MHHSNVMVLFCFQYNRLYRHLVGEPIEEFLFFSYNLREVLGDGDVSDGTQCPACPQVRYIRVIP